MAGSERVTLLKLERQSTNGCVMMTAKRRTACTTSQLCGKGGYGDFQNTKPKPIAYSTHESVCLWFQKHPRSRSNSTLAPSTAREGLRLFCVNTYEQAASENRACRACTACERRMHMLMSAVAPAMVQAHRLGAGWA